MGWRMVPARILRRRNAARFLGERGSENRFPSPVLGALSGGADPERVQKGVESAWQHLVREEEGLVLLFEPPFDTMEPSPGYIKGYPPGVRENGGQYTHAALWFAMALARRGDGERAARVLRMLNPIEHTGDPEAVVAVRGRAVRDRGRRVPAAGPHRPGRLVVVHGLRRLDVPGLGGGSPGIEDPRESR